METFEKSLLGSVALSKQYLTRQQLDEALEVQANSAVQGVRPPRLGEILLSRGYLTHEQLRSILSGRAGTGTLFGEIAEAWGLCSGEQIDKAIAQQIEYRLQRRRPARIGELLLASGALKAHQIHAVLKAQGKQVVQCPSCSTSYNALHVKEGLSVQCPRCNTAFIPVPPPTETTVDGEPIVDVRSDATAFLPAVEDEATQQRNSARMAVVPSLGIEQYKIESRIGADASGLLYRAMDTSRVRTVTLRVIPEDKNNGAGLEAWRQAAEAAGQLSHPHVQRVLGTHFEQGKLVVVSEFSEGQSLRQLLQRGGKLDVSVALNILIQCAEALTHALGKQVIHGDLRPSRVILSPSNDVQICGLGMPKRVHANLRMLTGSSGAVPLYAAPEVLRDADSMSEHSDVYSLCALGYHMLTGRAPQIVSLTHRNQLRAAPPTLLAPDAINPTIPSYVSRMLLKGLARNAGDRYASARELLEDLNTCRNALKDHVAEVPAIAPFFDRHGVLRAPASRVSAPAVRHRRHKTAWRSHGGTRLTLSDPPPPTQFTGALSDEECESRRAAGACPVIKKHEPQWTGAHTAAVVVAAVVTLICTVVLLRPASSSGPAASKSVDQTAVLPTDDAIWELRKDLDENVLAYRRQRPQDFNEIRYRADQFVRKHEAKYSHTEPVRMAKTIRLEQAKVGAAKSRPALEKKVQDLLQQDRFKDALAEVSRWAGYWGKDAVGADEQVLRDHIKAEQQGHASAWLSQGQASRAQGAWDRARESFRKVQEQFDTELVEQARHEEKATEEAELRAKTDRNVALVQQERARLLAQREAAAPSLLRKLVNDLQEPLASLNFSQAWRVTADAEADLVGTKEALAYQTIRAAIGRIEGLLDRAVQTAAQGRLNDFKLHVKDWDGFIADATRDGPLVKSGDVQAGVSWTSLEPGVLSDIFERCTDNENPNEVLDLALFHLYRGDPSKAEVLLDRAQGLGAMVDHHREVIPIMCWVASSAEAKVSAAERSRELEGEAITRASLKGMEWEVSQGRWVVNPDWSFEGMPDPGTTLMSLRRPLSKFDRIELELRGQGDAAGFSFGKGRRFLIRPISVWQKISLHTLPGGRLELRVDGEKRDSLETLQVSFPENATQELFLRAQGTRIEFRNFAIDGQVVRPHIGVSPRQKTVFPGTEASEKDRLDAL